MNKIGYIFDLNDNIYYHNHQEVCDLFAIKATPRKTVTDIDISNSLWFPIMEGCKDKDWDNKITEAGDIILSKYLKGITELGKKKILVTFGKIKIHNNEKYKFLGVFVQTGKEKSYIKFKKIANSFIALPNSDV